MVKRAYADVAVSFSGPHNYDTSSSNKPLEVWIVNDNPFDNVSLDIVVQYVPWSVTASLTGGLVWKGRVDIPAGRSELIHSIDVGATLEALGGGCSASTCFVQAIVAGTSDKSTVFVPEAVHFLTSIKYATNIGQSVQFSITDMVALNSEDDAVIQFTLTMNETSPFVLLELWPSESREGGQSELLDGIAGWFSDNNFVGVAGTPYTLSYTFFDREQAFDLEKFQKHLHVRALQSVPTAC